MLSLTQQEDLLWQKNWYSNISDELEEHPRKDSGAEVPVPDRLLPKKKMQVLLLKLKLSQKIGLLLWMNKNDLLSRGGEERLLYLQRKASEEALLSGFRFCSRLSQEKKLSSDFFPFMVELNRRPQSKRFRKTAKSRIGVGYRDKGTLPDKNSLSRTLAQKESWLNLFSLPEDLQSLIRQLVPQLIEEEWLDLSGLTDYFDDLEVLRDQLLLNQL